MSVINYETPEIAVRYEKMRIADRAQMKNFRIGLGGKRGEDGKIIKGTGFFEYLGTIDDADKAEKVAESLEKDILEIMQGNGHFKRTTVAEALGRETNDGSFKRAWVKLLKNKQIRMDEKSKKFVASDTPEPDKEDPDESPYRDGMFYG